MKVEKSLSIKKALKIVEQFLKASGPIQYAEVLNEIEYWTPAGPQVTARRLTIRTYPGKTNTLTKDEK